VLAHRERWMEPQAHQEGETEWIFLRFYDFEADGLLTFNLVTLRRGKESAWSQQVMATRLRPLRQAEIMAQLTATGFGNIRCYGNMSGAPFEAETSGNLVVTAEAKRCNAT
jgi:hypothetical protein